MKLHEASYGHHYPRHYQGKAFTDMDGWMKWCLKQYVLEMNISLRLKSLNRSLIYCFLHDIHCTIIDTYIRFMDYCYRLSILYIVILSLLITTRVWLVLFSVCESVCVIKAKCCHDSKWCVIWSFVMLHEALVVFFYPSRWRPKEKGSRNVSSVCFQPFCWTESSI